MKSSGKNLFRYCIDGLHLESAVGAVKPSSRMVHAQSRLDEGLSFDPPDEVCFHRGNHQPKMFPAKLVQKAEVPHNHEQRNRMIPVLYLNRGFIPVEVHAVVEMGANDRISHALRIHLYRCQVIYFRLHAEDLRWFVA